MSSAPRRKNKKISHSSILVLYKHFGMGCLTSEGGQYNLRCSRFRLITFSGPGGGEAWMRCILMLESEARATTLFETHLHKEKTSLSKSEPIRQSAGFSVGTRVHCILEILRAIIAVCAEEKFLSIL